MKNFDLSVMSVREMTAQEVLMIDGGNIFVDAWNWIKGAVSTIADLFKQYVADVAVEVLKVIAEEGIKELNKLLKNIV